MKDYAILVTLKRNEKVDVEQSKFRGVNVDLLITEILRYAGVVNIVKGREEGPELVFTIHRAGAKGSEPWAKMNSERIRSFGIQAVPVLMAR